MLGLGYPELILILLAVLVIFGPKKLPEIGKGIGEGLRALRQSTEAKDEETEAEKAKATAPAETSAPQKVEEPIKAEETEVMAESAPEEPTEEVRNKES